MKNLPQRRPGRGSSLSEEHRENAKRKKNSTNDKRRTNPAKAGATNAQDAIDTGLSTPDS